MHDRPARFLPLLAAVALTFAASATAQSEQRALGSLLPDTTVAAFYYTPDAAGHRFLESLADDLDLDAAKATVAKLANLLGEEFDDEFGDAFGYLFDGDMNDAFDEAWTEMGRELESECPALGTYVAGGHEALEGLLGPSVLAVSMSAYNPIPSVILVTRPTDRSTADGIYDALVGCYDAGVSLKQDGVDLHLFGDGGDQPLLASRVGGAFMLSTDQDLVRASVRLALGASEPSHTSHRIGSLAAGPMSRGAGMTLDLAALADALDGLRGFVQDDAYAVAADRFIATLRVINGVAISARFDDAGLAIESLVTVDEGVAHDLGETALLDLLSCTGCATPGTALIPTGAASVWAGTFSPAHLVTWIDSWLHDLEPLGAGDLDVRGLVSEYLGADLDAALLDWLGTGWLNAQLEVYDTDIRSWVSGPASVTVVPVWNEAAARDGLVLWQDLIRNVSSLSERMMDAAAFGIELGEELPAEAGDALAALDMLSVRPVTYRGVTYERWRMGPLSDAGVLVVSDQLVITTPSTVAEAVIDVYLGGQSITSDPRFGPLLASQPAGATSYEVVDVPRYLRGFAELADLASAPIASLLQVGLVAALESGEIDQAELQAGSLPSFDELLSLTDLGTQVFEALAARAGTAVGTTEHIGGAIWTTWRLPLR